MSAWTEEMMMAEVLKLMPNGQIVRKLCYGENKDSQSPAFVVKPNDTTLHPLAIGNFQILEGKATSFCNETDIARLLQTTTHLAAVFPPREHAIAVGMKHNNACGAGVSTKSDPGDALLKMINGHPRAIFGGMIMVNFTIDEELADLLVHYNVPQGGKRRPLDTVAAPSFTTEAVEILARKKTGKCRVLQNPALANSSLPLCQTVLIRQLFDNEFGVQPNYTYVPSFDDPALVVTGERRLFKEADLLFAWAISATSNSNTIVIAKDLSLKGNGRNEQDRVGAAELAVRLSSVGEHDLDDAVVWSDSFFPFPDGVEVLAAAGVRTIFATSGSDNDELVRQRCAELGVTLYQLPDAEARTFYGHAG